MPNNNLDKQANNVVWVLGILILALLVCPVSCKTTGSVSQHILNQQEVISRQEVQLNQIDANNKRAAEVLEGLSSDVTDLKEWKIKMQEAINELKALNSSNNAILHPDSD